MSFAGTIGTYEIGLSDQLRYRSYQGRKMLGAAKDEVGHVLTTVVRSMKDIADAGLRKLMQVIQGILRITGDCLTFMKTCLSPTIDMLQAVELFTNIHTLVTDWAKHTKAKVVTISNGILCGIIGLGMLLDNFRIAEVGEAIGKIPVLGPALTSLPSPCYLFMNIFAGIATMANMVNDFNTMRGANKDKGSLSRKENIECQKILEMIGSITNKMKDYLECCKMKRGQPDAQEFADAFVTEEFELQLARLAALDARFKYNGPTDSTEVTRNVKDAVCRVLGIESMATTERDPNARLRLSLDQTEADGKETDAQLQASPNTAVGRARSANFSKKLDQALIITDEQVKAYGMLYKKLLSYQLASVDSLNGELIDTNVKVNNKKTEIEKCNAEIAAAQARIDAAKAEAEAELTDTTTVNEEGIRRRTAQMQQDTQAIKAIETRRTELELQLDKLNPDFAEDEDGTPVKKLTALNEKVTKIRESREVLELSRLVSQSAQRQLDAIAKTFENYEAAKTELAEQDAKHAARKAALAEAQRNGRGLETAQADITQHKDEHDKAKAAVKKTTKEFELEDAALTKMTKKYKFVAHNYHMDGRKPLVGLGANLIKLAMHVMFVAGILTGAFVLSINSPWMIMILAVMSVTAYAKIYVDNSKYEEDKYIKPLVKPDEIIQFSNAAPAA